ncbi:hypothetical protein P9578_28475 [Brevibacillus choshinensis]|uniref:hypothetical protein n=1 Tax=Brevibacillus choshinensis TaxID=54911 RepID=UPI002E1A6333|nr:hypothetical protein [Brevibacillus choshinensis]
MDKLAELSRQVTRCELSLDEAEKDLKQLDDAMNIIRKKRNQAQDQVNYWQMKLWETEKELDELRNERVKAHETV